MKKTSILAAILCSLFSFSALAEGFQREIPGAKLADEHGCIACHVNKADVIDQNDNIIHAPNIVGKWARSISNDLKKFRSGEKVRYPMNFVAANLTDQEIKDLAYYISNYSRLNNQSAEGSFGN